MSAVSGAGSREDQRRWMETPNGARLYNWLLGDVENMRADRVAAQALEQVAPWLRTAALINRDFAQRSVSFAVAAGVRQFLDLGCGYPVRRGENTHEIAQGCRVVYVDHDWCVCAHARTTLENGPREYVVRADLRDMKNLLASPEVCKAIDLREPVAVGLHDVLPWITDDDAVEEALGVLREWMPHGSLLSLTHFTDHWHPDTIDTVVGTYAVHQLDLRPRSWEKIGALFGDFTGPGIAEPHLWYPGSEFRDHPPEHAAAFAGIARKVA
ncbi:SAM-dependent methyltransferase [Streptomyces sp. NBC_00237]|uniref:SAM-dependent methyltransferase n=1 Tax=Streptomyces sp. NBC_00237 TaxID=2975687 RepID=UPI0022597465|nr:SAM-dependent methyltransferase [Streptomyces sp. NBC_00237]MCX5206075.1 SAM-dependent methyltransferase [Streptomyces sp. NBC_00237]